MSNPFQTGDMSFRGRTERNGTPRAVSTRPKGGDIPLNLSFGNFEFEDMKRMGRRGGGVRELAALLRNAQRRTAVHSTMLSSSEGLEQRNAELLRTATRRAAGEKVKDDPKRLAKALARRRNKKRSSAKKWAGRLRDLQQSVETVVEDRSATRRAAKAQRENRRAKVQNRKHDTSRAGGGATAAGKKSKKRNNAKKTPSAAKKNGKKRQGKGRKAIK